MRKDFCLCFNDGYVPYASVTIKSIIDHARKEDDVHIHIISDYITPENKVWLENFGNIHLYIYDGNSALLRDVKTSIWSIYTWYRILLPQMLGNNIHRVLYLDCDIIVNSHLDELFTMDMTEKSIAACIDIQSYGNGVYERLGYDFSKKYICAGVLMMNLDRWRETDLSKRITDFVRTCPEKIEFPDQDAVNYICQDDKIILHPKYGVLVPFFRDERFIKENIAIVDELIESPEIIHYAGYAPWVYCKNKSIHSNLWWNTYRSLHHFPQVKLDYIKSIFKYYFRYVISNLHLIGKENKYHIDQYYHHPKVTRSSVYKLITRLNKSN